MRPILLSLLLSSLLLRVEAQHSNIFLGDSYFSNFEQDIYSVDRNLHTSFKPLLQSDLHLDLDSILESKYPAHSENWYLRKVFSEYLIIIEDKDYKVIMSPIINLSLGKDLADGKQTYTNTRGFILKGNLGTKFYFSSSFMENQSVFPDYLDRLIRVGPEDGWVISGQGVGRVFKKKGFDYAMSSGYISYRINKMFNIQFGHGKNFIGDGYRSLLLSDNTFNYPYLKLQTTFWKVQYTNLYAEFQDLNYFQSNGIANYDQMGFAKKYMSSHYLSVNLNKKFNISLFESVIWRANHAPGSNGFDLNYLNPIAIIRPLEFSLNSPDNVLVGVTSKYKMFLESYIYGQFILDEFSINDLRKSKGFWGNKYGYQLGYKMYNSFLVDNWSLQLEYNSVRPYTYAHYNPLQNYAHYNQPLAHPLGANFSELLFLSRYRWKRWQLDGRLIFARYGAAIEGDPTSYGNNVYESTGAFEEPSGFIHEGRPSDFNIKMYQGNLTYINFRIINLSYIVNPKTNFKINLGFLQRDFEDEYSSNQTDFISFGMESDLFNNYYDF